MWPHAKLKFVARFGYGEALPADELQEGTYRVYGSNGPYASFSRANTGAPAIIVGRKGSYGKVNWTPGPCFASDTTFFVDSSTSRNHLRWVYWLLQTLRLDEGTAEAAVPGLNRETAYSQDVLVPPLPKQRAIADYLDRETARLDMLVAAKERQLELLAEKRRALITRAVTRGLDPGVPLRDSGITWFGKIPTHWNTPPVYARFEVQLGKMLDEKKIKGTHLAPYLRNVDVQWGLINITDLPEMDFDENDRHRYSLQAGDILVCEGGDVGRCAIWDGTYTECYYQKALHRLRPIGGKDDASFFVFVMRAIVDAGLFSSQSSAATIQHLPAEKLRVVRYPAPPLDEQRAIVTYIASETAELDAMKTATERTISLLRERRAALISAAVTGHVDVEVAA